MKPTPDTRRARYKLVMRYDLTIQFKRSAMRLTHSNSALCRHSMPPGRAAHAPRASWQRSAFGVLFFFGSGLALAGPPFITDDPEPVDFRAWEINYGLTYLHAAGLTSGALTSFDINYGVYPGVQSHVQPQLAYFRGPAGRVTGPGDTEVGIKYRLTPEAEDKSGRMLAIYPMLQLPSGNARRNLGAGARSVYLPLWAQTTRGKWTVFGGGGFRMVSTLEGRNSRAGGITALYQFSERLQFGGEVFGETRTTSDGRASTSVNIGGVYRLTKELSLLFSAGHGLRNASANNQGAAYFGIRSTY